MPHAPPAYAEGYAKARLYDPTAADNYIKHTTIGDHARPCKVEAAIVRQMIASCSNSNHARS